MTNDKWNIVVAGTGYPNVENDTVHRTVTGIDFIDAEGVRHIFGPSVPYEISRNEKTVSVVK